jgi:tetratricopeptide (TPR) repeat protein
MSRYDEVTRSCDALLAKDKLAAPLFELRGMARSGKKDFAGAIDDFTQAIALQPNRAGLYVRRGTLYLVSDAPKLARPDFEQAIRLDPSSADAMLGRGGVRARLGEYEAAVLDAQKAIAMGVPSAERLYQAARIYARSATAAKGTVRSKGRDAVNLAERYQDLGTALLRRALRKLSGPERESFWRDIVQADPDPAMNVLRRRLRSSDMAGTSNEGG